MKAISLWQPWATLWVMQAKRFETRSWATSHRGPLLVHASLRWTRQIAALCRTEPFRSALRDIGFPDAAGLPRGQIIGICDGVLCHRIGLPPPEPERSFGDYTPGRYAWIPSNMRAIAPFPLRGRQGLFNVDYHPQSRAAVSITAASLGATTESVDQTESPGLFGP